MSRLSPFKKGETTYDQAYFGFGIGHSPVCSDHDLRSRPGAGTPTRSAGAKCDIRPASEAGIGAAKLADLRRFIHEPEVQSAHTNHSGECEGTGTEVGISVPFS